MDWKVHPRIIGNPPQSEGPLAGIEANIEEQVARALGKLGWDPETAKPSKEKLLELGLDSVAQDLWP